VYWGFYFVAAPNGNIGIRDLHDVLAELRQNGDWERDISVIHDDDGRARKSDSNSRIATRALKKVLAARIVAFELFLEAVIKVDKKLEEKHKRSWLLFQLSNPRANTSVSHPVVQIMDDCIRQASNDALDELIRRLDVIREKYFSRKHFIVAVDEAQYAVRLYDQPFLSSTDATKYRSILREVSIVFTTRQVKLVVSGTGVTMDDLRDSMASGVSKHDTVGLYHNLGMFDTWPTLSSFLERYLPDALLESPSWHCLRTRIQEYLMGR
jgi:hypothetical protein